MLDIRSTIKLNNGTEMPLLGFGTWQAKDGKIAYDSVRDALLAGYRHIDTAKFYGNEESVGKAIRDSGIPRGEIFVTTKLWPTDVLNADKAFETSFAKLDIDYIDLYLIHFPIPGLVVQNWKKMEKIHLGGKVRSIGVSNHSISQIESILAIATIKPTVNQIKCSPYNYDPEMHEFCKKNDIAMEAYSPLTRGNKLNDEKLVAVAASYKKSPAQILLRWCIQKEIATLPKSVHKNRIKENADLFDFELSDKDIELLDSFSNKVVL